MSGYHRVMLGANSIHAKDCFAGGFIGVDFGITDDLAGRLPEEFSKFSAEFIPIYLGTHPDKTKVGAGLACGFLWSVAKGIKIGDFVLSPDGTGRYRVGSVTGDYYYRSGEILPHRRPVTWGEYIDRSEMSKALKGSTGSIGTVANVSRYEDEIQRLMGAVDVRPIISTDPTIEDPSAFAMEEHLEAFLVENWANTEFGKDYEIYSEDGHPVGRQYQTDAGPIDILAVSNDKKSLLVVELKKGRASDVVVGQILRYMGFAQGQLAEEGQRVVGAIIALDDDQKIRWALAITPTVSFYRYQVNFKLLKA